MTSFPDREITLFTGGVILGLVAKADPLHTGMIFLIGSVAHRCLSKLSSYLSTEPRKLTNHCFTIALSAIILHQLIAANVLTLPTVITVIGVILLWNLMPKEPNGLRN